MYRARAGEQVETLQHPLHSFNVSIALAERTLNSHLLRQHLQVHVRRVDCLGLST